MARDQQRSDADADRAVPALAFSQISATLISHGFLTAPLDIAGLSKESTTTLADAFHGLIAQRQKDVELRQSLASQNRVLESTLDRTKRFWKENEEKRVDIERKLEAVKAQLSTATTELNEAHTASRRTREELQRARRDLLTTKQQAAQQQQANVRELDRLRSRPTEENDKALRANVPTFRVPSTGISQPGKPSISSSSVPQKAPTAKLVEELRQEKQDLTSFNDALKLVAARAINLAREAGSHLSNAASGYLELGEGAKHSEGSGRGEPLKASPDTLFPPSQPLYAADDGFFSLKTSEQHPALKALRAAETIILSQLEKLQGEQVQRERTRVREAKKRELDHQELQKRVQERADELEDVLQELRQQLDDRDQHIQHSSRKVDKLSSINATAMAELDRQQRRIEELSTHLEQQAAQLAEEREQAARQPMQREDDLTSMETSFAGSGTPELDVVEQRMPAVARQAGDKENIFAQERERERKRLRKDEQDDKGRLYSDGERDVKRNAASMRVSQPLSERRPVGPWGGGSSSNINASTYRSGSQARKASTGIPQPTSGVPTKKAGGAGGGTGDGETMRFVTVRKRAALPARRHVSEQHPPS